MIRFFPHAANCYQRNTGISERQTTFVNPHLRHNLFFLFFLLLFIAPPEARSQITKDRKPASFDRKKTDKGINLVLDDAKIIDVNDDNQCIYRMIKPLVLRDHPTTIDIKNSNIVTASIGDIFNKYTQPPIQLDAKAALSLINNHIEGELNVSNIRGRINIKNCFAKAGYRFNNLQGILWLDSGAMRGQMQLVHSKLEELYLNLMRFTTYPSLINIENSAIQHMTMYANQSDHLTMNFIKDTLGQMHIEEQRPYSTPSSASTYQRSLFFRESRLDTLDVTIAGQQYITGITLDACNFGKNSKLKLVTDSLTLINCHPSEQGIVLDCTNNGRPVILRFEHTDLTNIDFDYRPEYQLYRFDDDELNRTNYENLLEKFNREKKFKSYELLKIEYFNFDHSWPVNFLNKIWWYYGYQKWLIILWTFVFLLVFSALNFWKWRQVLTTYPIIDVAAIENPATKMDLALKMFVFTAFIFFSLRIDFDKLTFSSTKALLYFFLQYLTGLTCLFFIVNAILKF